MNVNDTYKFELNYLTDWDGSELSDESEPRTIPSVKTLRELIELIRHLNNELDFAYYQLNYED